MTELLTRAFSAASELPEAQQDEIAHILLGLVGVEQSIVSLTPEEQADLDEADAEIARGEVMSREEAEALWAKRKL